MPIYETPAEQGEGLILDPDWGKTFDRESTSSLVRRHLPSIVHFETHLRGVPRSSFPLVRGNTYRLVEGGPAHTPDSLLPRPPRPRLHFGSPGRRQVLPQQRPEIRAPRPDASPAQVARGYL
eukprot:scaffold2516_cov108-Isochrysis_galbana.AAC.13